MFLDMLEDNFEMALDFMARMAQNIIGILELKRQGSRPQVAAPPQDR